MYKPGSIKLNQVRAAYAGFDVYDIDYCSKKNEEDCQDIYKHEMTCVDVSYAFKRLNLGSPQFYSCFPTLLFQHKNDVLQWCKLMNKLIGVEKQLPFLPDHKFDKIKKNLDEELKVFVFINKRKIRTSV